MKPETIKTVAVLMGGKSAERPVSLNSGEACAKALESKGYTVKRVDPRGSVADLIADLTPAPDVVFNALHGQYGEDGRVQGVLDLMGIPYTHSGLAASALAMDKRRAKTLLAAVGMPVVADAGITRDEMLAGAEEPLPRPFVLKPLSEGSSVGVYLFTDGKNIDLKTIAEREQSALWMAEAFIAGRELTCAVRENEALAVTEIIPSTEFYDFEAKYTDGITQHIIPAVISKELEGKIKRLSILAHEHLGCRGISRSDFRVDEAGQPFYLETNTQPGMTALSLVPEQAQFLGIEFPDLVEWMVEQAECDA